MLAEIPSDFYTKNLPLVDISFLFEIHSGVLDDRDEYYYVDENGKEKPLHMLRMSSFNLYEGELRSSAFQQEADKKLKANRRKKTGRQLKSKMNGETEKTKEKSARQKIKMEKKLDKYDFLICTRSYGGQSYTGISLLNTEIEFGDYIVSHHFLVLRPRRDTPLGINYSFLHILMESLVKLDAEQQTYLTNSKEGTSGTSRGWLIGKKVLLPPLEWQDKAVEYYKGLKAIITEKNMEIKTLQGELARHYSSKKLTYD